MCGIAGVISKSQISPEDLSVIHRMNQAQRHRGPDDEGFFSDDFCALGHRRLSIIDLTRDGHQPFFSDDHRYQMVYNGELYNYIELRSLLEDLGWTFRTRTDTEVLLKAYLQFGKDCLTKFNGMFAFAVYDRKRQTLFLARDRMGIKPLYYTIQHDTLYFSSEVKALLTIPGLSRQLNTQSLFDFLVFNRTDIFDETFLSEIKRIPKGHYGLYASGKLQVGRWWDPQDYLSPSPLEDVRQIKDKIRDLLCSSVQLRMRSDVPVGSCLSGGLDSSIILGILVQQEMADQQFRTFTASFPGHSIDETRYIDGLKEKYHFKSDLTFPDAETAYEALQEFVYVNDEPVTTPSFFSQYRVMKKAAESGVVVLLDGQGGDEIFAGYQYFHGFNLYGLIREKAPLRFMGEFLRSLVRKQHISAYQTLLFQLLPAPVKKQVLLRATPFITREFFDEYIDTSVIYNEFFNADDLNISLVRHLQYKLEHLLRMEDRNSMAYSLEARVPYLDHRLVEFLLGVSPRLKIKDGETKFLQKEALGRYTTPQILKRKDKIGFGTPGEAWMQTPDWQSLTRENYTDVCDRYKGVFKKAVQLPSKGFHRWKVNQLATWSRMVTGHRFSEPLGSSDKGGLKQP